MTNDDGYEELRQIAEDAKALAETAIKTNEWQAKCMKDMLELMEVWASELPPEFIHGATNILVYALEEIPEQ